MKNKGVVIDFTDEIDYVAFPLTISSLDLVSVRQNVVRRTKVIYSRRSDIDILTMYGSLK